MGEVLWNRMTAAELVALAKKDAIVLLPVASTEQHGPHLATGVDTFLAGEGCRRTALLVQKKKPVVVAPTVWIGLAEHHIEFGGSFTVSLPTYHAMLYDICRSILRAGFSKILIVNGHGGNVAALNALTTDLCKELEAPIATTTLYALPMATKAYDAILEDQSGVQHACEAETSMMMAAFPDCVRRNKLKQAVGPKTADAPFRSAIAVWRSFKDLTKTGVFGDARRSTAEKGEKLLDMAAEMLAKELVAGKPWA